MYTGDAPRLGLLMKASPILHLIYSIWGSKCVCNTLILKTNKLSISIFVFYFAFPLVCYSFRRDCISVWALLDSINHIIWSILVRVRVTPPVYLYIELVYIRVITSGEARLISHIYKSFIIVYGTIVVFTGPLSLVTRYLPFSVLINS